MDMTTLLILIFAAITFIVAIVITAFSAWKHSRGRSYAIHKDDELINKGDISLEDAMKYLKLTNKD